EMTYTAGGGVETIRIGDRLFPGTKLRSLLGLRSTAFSVAVEGDTAVFSTRGYGHRVGMSQYGADAMAESGADYAQILAHYYRGTELVLLEG
ncbi:MAG: stage II sporulation protein D, partial [Clostridia bacterium]|nr:stage II sporulation protein D [Clostridia bacterium]